jgi:hypothetical protein
MSWRIGIYRLTEELEAEHRKRQCKEFRQQTWHVWERVEIESYLICPAGLVRHITRLVEEMAGSVGPIGTLEDEVGTEVEAAIEGSRHAARRQLIESFDRWNREARKGWATSTVVSHAEEFLDRAWQGDRRLEWCDPKESVFPRLREAIKRRWKVALSPRDLIQSLAADDTPAEMAQVVEGIAAFLEASRWINTAEPDHAGIRALGEALKNADAGIRRSAAEALGAKGYRAVPALCRALRNSNKNGAPYANQQL